MDSITMKTVVIDTEFTSFEKPVLLSIGLVKNDGELYCELDTQSETFAKQLPLCSEFVKEVVLTQFDNVPGSSFQSHSDMANAIATWLLDYSQGDEILIAFDYPLDWELLVETLGKGDASRCERVLAKLRPFNVDVFAATAVAQIAVEEFWSEQCESSQMLKEHHALADARALWAAMSAVAHYRK